VSPRVGQVVEVLAASRRDPQAFLGAPWVSRLLALAPTASRETLALWVLSISPHYFYPRKRGLAGLRDEHERLRRSRRLLADVIVRQHVSNAECIVDYGCGPGYLASSLSPLAQEVVGLDISGGAIACAQIINGRQNVRFELIESGIIPLPNESVDAICSFAVIQHMADADFQLAMAEFARVVKPEGRVICHIPVDKPEWESEAAWRNDQTLRGRLKLKYALNCFGRTRAQVCEAIERAGFGPPQIFVAGELGEIEDVDIAAQELFVFAPRMLA
jgi:SAM-dependent methyltransferase